MRKIGLALSGGGFRATLFHLGLVRFLRDAGILPAVTHISSVSGGSILAAHLVLNWSRYNGSANDFDLAAAEVLDFVRLDVRNRILRRFPLAASLRWLRRALLFGPDRRLTRPGLLEYHYQQYLYGDVRLSELPASPQLHILATDLSDGCLCSFHRDGLLIQRRLAGHRFRLDHLYVGLATVPTAVAASSAFPGFFPPLELTGPDVGAGEGEFPLRAFTDGGVYDNLGVRLFRCLERTWLAEAPLTRDDFCDFEVAAAALGAASRSHEETPLRWLAQVLVAPARQPGAPRITAGAAAAERHPGVPQAGAPQAGAPEAGAGDGRERLLESLSELILHHQFHREPLFAGLKLDDAHAQALLHRCRHNGRGLDADDLAWLNRHLLEAAFRQATGGPCFRRLNSSLDGVLVSDVGKTFGVRGSGHAGGLIRTAMRSADILMDRVWQLEKETFGDTPGFTFAPITDVVDPADDPTALPAEVQRQAARIRTDLDRFSPLEISSLVRHGYCVGRQACRSRPELFGPDLPREAPWDPVPAPPAPAPAPTRLGAPPRAPTRATLEARALQASEVRRIWSRLLDYRDWVSYVYVPLIVPILLLAPYLAVRSYQRSHRINQLVAAMAQGGPELAEMTRLLENGPDAPWTGVEAEEVPRLDPPDNKGYEVLQDSRIIDLRAWKPGVSGRASSWINSMRHVRVHKVAGEDGDDHFRLQLLTTNSKVDIRFPPQELPAKLRVSRRQTDAGVRRFVWEASYDFRTLPRGQMADLLYRYVVTGSLQEAADDLNTLRFPIENATAELNFWILMPEGREYSEYKLTRFPTDKPAQLEPFRPATEYLADDYTILAFKLLSLKAGYTYELRWDYKQ